MAEAVDSGLVPVEGSEGESIREDGVKAREGEFVSADALSDKSVRVEAS